MASLRPPSLYANLSGMLPQAPRLVNSESAPQSAAEISQRGASPAAAAAPQVDPPIDHHCQVCPTCGQRLTGHRCKLVCSGCGYYMSCADYY